MAYQALYREWRPKNFNDVVGQEHITTTLKNQIINDRIAHAYLFCGTRGTGKTSTAKVFAKALNCLDLQDGEPCNKCEMCEKINKGLAIDVTELDAASNNRIENIREIIDDIQYPPQEAKYKVYIMDEVHMLSIGAVNAFLKTLEEPPKNVIFILATTDPQKLPITILSRCQRFDFRRINNSDIEGRLRKIVEAQGVLADEKSLSLIARVSDGAMRDSLSILDQAISIGDGRVDYDVVVSMLGLVTNQHLFELTDTIIERNVEKAVRVIDSIVYAGKDMYLFTKDLISHYRNILMVKVTNNPEEVLDMSVENIELLKQQGDRIRIEEIMRAIRILQEAEENAKMSKQARLYLELAVIKLCKIEYDTSKEVILSRINRLEEAIKSGNIKINVKSQGQTQGQDANNKQTVAQRPKSNHQIETQVKSQNGEASHAGTAAGLSEVKKAWRDILEAFKNRRAMVIYASLVTGAPVSANEDEVIIEYDDQYAFNKNRLEKTENSKVVNEVFSEILRRPIKVKYKVFKEDSERQPEDILREAIGEDVFKVFDE